jgi:hypothetical protein
MLYKSIIGVNGPTVFTGKILLHLKGITMFPMPENNEIILSTKFSLIIIYILSVKTRVSVE